MRLSSTGLGLAAELNGGGLARQRRSSNGGGPPSAAAGIWAAGRHQRQSMTKLNRPAGGRHRHRRGVDVLRAPAAVAIFGANESLVVCEAICLLPHRQAISETSSNHGRSAAAAQ